MSVETDPNSGRIAEIIDIKVGQAVWCQHRECDAPRADGVKLFVTEGGMMFLCHDHHEVLAANFGEGGGCA